MKLVPGKLYRNNTEWSVSLWSLDWQGIVACVYPGDMVLYLGEYLFLTNTGFVAKAPHHELYSGGWEQVS